MDGDGWTRCAAGHRHWGRFGAAGLLLLAPDGGGTSVLLQLRAGWSHHGGTWGLPGGARALGETAVEAALRECAEEVAVDLSQVRVQGTSDDDHGGWRYTTVVARVPGRLPAAATGGESEDVAWVPLADVPRHGAPTTGLHPGLAAGWTRLAPLLAAAGHPAGGDAG